MMLKVMWILILLSQFCICGAWKFFGKCAEPSASRTMSTLNRVGDVTLFRKRRAVLFREGRHSTGESGRWGLPLASHTPMPAAPPFESHLDHHDPNENNYLKQDYHKNYYVKRDYPKQDYQKPEYQKPEYQNPEYQKPEYQKPEYQKTSDPQQMVPVLMELLKNQIQNLEGLQQTNENQNFLNENNIQHDVDIISGKDKFMYDRSKGRLGNTLDGITRPMYDQTIIKQKSQEAFMQKDPIQFKDGVLANYKDSKFSMKKFENPKDEEYIMRETNEEAEKYALEHKSLNNYDNPVGTYQKEDYPKHDYQKQEYHKPDIDKTNFQNNDNQIFFYSKPAYQADDFPKHDYKKQEYQTTDYIKPIDHYRKRHKSTTVDSLELLRNQQINLKLFDESNNFSSKYFNRHKKTEELRERKWYLRDDDDDDDEFDDETIIEIFEDKEHCTENETYYVLDKSQIVITFVPFEDNCKLKCVVNYMDVFAMFSKPDKASRSAEARDWYDGEWFCTKSCTYTVSLWPTVYECSFNMTIVKIKKKLICPVYDKSLGNVFKRQTPIAIAFELGSIGLIGLVAYEAYRQIIKRRQGVIKLARKLRNAPCCGQHLKTCASQTKCPRTSC